MNAYDVILKPVMSEKAYDGIAEKRYTFKVSKSANKIEIKQAVEQIFGVSVEKVNTVNVRGRLKKQGRTQGYTAKYKKAVVTLKKDSKAIEFFESLS